MDKKLGKLRGKKILVTGAGGFIGSQLTEYLVSLGAQARAFVHYNALGTWGWLEDSTYKKEIEVHMGDIIDLGGASDQTKEIYRLTFGFSHTAKGALRS
jgi:nucleoside-diphosphate-sugar epimerase